MIGIGRRGEIEEIGRGEREEMRYEHVSFI